MLYRMVLQSCICTPPSRLQVWDATDGLAHFPPEYTSLFASPALRAKLEAHNIWSKRQHQEQYGRYKEGLLDNAEINLMQVALDPSGYYQG